MKYFILGVIFSLAVGLVATLSKRQTQVEVVDETGKTLRGLLEE